MLESLDSYVPLRAWVLFECACEAGLVSGCVLDWRRQGVPR